MIGHHQLILPPREELIPRHRLLSLASTFSVHPTHHPSPPSPLTPPPLHLPYLPPSSLRELARVRRDLDELKLEVEDLERGKERADAGWHVEQLQLFLDQCTKGYRSAVVQAKRTIDSSQHYLNREELLAPATSGRDSPAPNSHNGAPQSEDDALMSATSDVTEGLRRTLQLLQSEVDRSQVSNELLEQQTQTLSSTTVQYSRLSTLLSSSKSLITSLERADVLDRLVLFGAFSFFVGVCSYIFKKRVVDRGIKVASAVTGVLGRTGAGGGGGRGNLGEVKEIVKEEFKGEIEKVVMATAAVVGAVKKARDVVQEKLKGREVVPEEREEERGVLQEVVQQVTEQTRTTEPIATQTSSSTTTTSSIPTSTPIPEPEEEEIEFDDPESEESLFGEPIPVSSEPDLSSSITSTAAVHPPDPTSTPPSHDDGISDHQVDQVYSPEPTPEPTPTPPPSHNADVEEEATEEPSAEPEAEITVSQVPEPTSSETETNFSSPTPEEEQEEANEIDIVNPRQAHPPVPAHSREELEEIFDSAPSPSPSTSTTEPLPPTDIGLDSTPIEDLDASPDLIDLDPLPSSTSTTPLQPENDVEEEIAPNLDHTTTPLDASAVDPETIPPLDVEENLESEPVSEGENVVELPIDLEREQTIWEESPAREDEAEEEEREGDGEKMNEEEGEERLLEEMMERQFGGDLNRVGAYFNETGGIEEHQDEETPTVLEDEEEVPEPPSETMEEPIIDIPQPESTPEPFSSSVPVETPPSTAGIPESSSLIEPTPALPNPESTPSSILYESTPTPTSEPLSDIVRESTELPVIDDIGFDQLGSVTDPDPLYPQEEEVEQEESEHSVELPEPTPTPTPTPSSSASATITTPLPSCIVSAAQQEYDSLNKAEVPVFESQVFDDEEEEEEPNHIVDVPTPAPAPIPEVSHVVAQPTEPVESKPAEEEEQLSAPLPIESIPSSDPPIPVATPSPEPTATPAPSAESQTIAPQSTEPDLPSEDEDLTNSDVVFPPADIDEDELNQPDEALVEEEDLPIFEQVELETGNDEFETSRNDDDDDREEEEPLEEEGDEYIDHEPDSDSVEEVDTPSQVSAHVEL
ncbi:uncharacterized protein JCM6883_006587 [Sporobolomyces salmoneus]|uniref:uncharacterized protein n=1 Tax=Sporobolomyces salmoneus TaxID=183962 RepID=UPI00317C0C43